MPDTLQPTISFLEDAEGVLRLEAFAAGLDAKYTEAQKELERCYSIMTVHTQIADLHHILTLYVCFAA